MMPITDREMFAKRGLRFMHWTQRICLVVGVLLVSYVGLTLLRARIFERDAGIILVKQIHAQEQHLQTVSTPTILEGDVLGRLEIPRLNFSVAILQGTSSETLLLGVGHIAGTDFPGGEGNVGIAGHRDTYFRTLKDIRVSDEIMIQTASELSRYKVDWIQITRPGDGEILNVTNESALTLVTCYPFYYVGSAPERFVVHAHRL